MSKESAVIVLGILTLVIPQLGVPSPWRTTMLVLVGIALVIIGLYLRAERAPRQRPGQSYVEHVPEKAPEQPHDSQ